MKHIRRETPAFSVREEKIITAAFDLFSTHGVESVSMDMIAGTAGVGKGTIYKHFKSKNEIFAILVICQMEEVMERLRQVPRDAPVMIQLKRTMRTFWDYQTENIERFGIYRKCEQLMQTMTLSPDILSRLVQQKTLRDEFIRSMIRKAVAEEIFADEAEDNLTAVSVGLFRGVFDLISQGEVESCDDLYRLVEKVIFNGFMR